MFLVEKIVPCRVVLEPVQFFCEGEATQDNLQLSGYVLPKSVQCIYCHLVFESSSFLDIHVKSTHKTECRRKCYECNIYFLTRRDKENHLEEVHEETAYKCTFCKKVVNRNNYKLRLHIQKCHSNSKILVCFNSRCHRHFFTAQERNNHFLRSHEHIEKGRKCAFSCDMLFKTTTALHVHYKRVHSGAYFRCDYKQKCASYFKNKQDLAAHVLKVHETFTSLHTRRTKCIYCNRWVMVNDIRRHTKDYHEGKNIFRCRYAKCVKFFRSEQERQEHDAQAHSLKVKGSKKCRFCQIKTHSCNMRRHLRVHHKNESIGLRSCNLCGYYGSLEELQNHYKENHKSEECRILKCIYCGNFYVKEAILSHVKHMHGEQAIKCTFPCITFFNSEADRDEHIFKVHSKAPLIQKWVCIYCHITLSKKSALHTHVKNMHKEIHIKCSVQGCGEYFLSQSDKRKHNENHTEEEASESLNCIKCDYKTNLKQSLLEHYNRKHVSAKFKCPRCSVIFQSKTTYDQHVRLVHRSKGKKKCQHCNRFLLDLRAHQRWTKCENCQIVTPCIVKTRQHITVCNSNGK